MNNLVLSRPLLNRNQSKPIPIAGTAIVLDNPDALQTWIADRKRRWPTVARVHDKKCKADEALARGQLSAQDLGIFGSKRRRCDIREDKPRKQLRVIPTFAQRVESSSSDDDEPPEPISSKQSYEPSEPLIRPDPVPSLPKWPVQRSRKASPNPFAPRSNLLHSVCD